MKLTKQGVRDLGHSLNRRASARAMCRHVWTHDFLKCHCQAAMYDERRCSPCREFCLNCGETR